MAKLTKRGSRKLGLPPGTLVHVGDKKTDSVRISVTDYDSVNFREEKEVSVEGCFSYKDSPTVSWINIDGLHQTDVVQRIGEGFGLHPLIMEDIVSTEQRPKVEDFDDYLYAVLRMISYNEVDRDVVSEQVSIILGQNYVLSFQEQPGDVFGPVRERIAKAKGRIRSLGPDYLFYALIDAVVDHYFLVIEKIGERIEALEEDLINNPTPVSLQEIYDLKRSMINLRRSVWPLREMVGNLERGDSNLIKETTEIYLRDVYDHTIQVIDTIETFRDMITGMLDIYLSSISNKMNSVMKVLTIFASIFIPLTFIAGVYGMNFERMPELKWAWGYPAVWGVMAVVTAVLLMFFKKKDWL